MLAAGGTEGGKIEMKYKCIESLSFESYFAKLYQNIDFLLILAVIFLFISNESKIKYQVLEKKNGRGIP